MKKKYTTKRSGRNERWLSYSGLAVTFLGVAPKTHAQVQHVDVDPDMVIQGTSADFDIDDDGDLDITLKQFVNSYGNPFCQGLGANGIDALGSMLGYAAVPSVLASGDMIGEGNPNWRDGFHYAQLFWLYNGNPGGFWGGEHGFLGLRFPGADGLPHYAWMELQIAADASQMTLMSYAYEATPNVPIIAGTSTGVTSAGAEAFAVRAYPDPVIDQVTIELPPAIKQADVRLYSATGQLVQGANAGGQSKLTLDLGQLPSGIYFVEVQSGESVVRRKLVKG